MLCVATAALTLGGVPAALAQQPHATPSADELWQDYPLRDHAGHELPGTGPPVGQQTGQATRPSGGTTTTTAPGSGSASGAATGATGAAASRPAPSADG